MLDEFRAKKKEAAEKNGDKKESKDSKENGDEKSDGEEGEDKDDKKEGESNDGLDEFTKREDRVAKAGLDAIMREYITELSKPATPGMFISI